METTFTLLSLLGVFEQLLPWILFAVLIHALLVKTNPNLNFLVPVIGGIYGVYRMIRYIMLISALDTITKMTYYILYGIGLLIVYLVLVLLPLVTSKVFGLREQ